MRLTKNKIAIVIRLFLSLFCVVLIAQGISSVYLGQFSYRNYWGGLVFGPFAILFGLLLLYLLVFRWKKLEEPMVDKKGRKISFPGDDYKKW